ncbi:zinc finger protein [Macleaya cordata]|uniref:Zinc finger protein n=1 Tax=Macleaya cordata TaxID=56857 RepID=A0A200PNH6_MACCD|nr:zinc finger protein [Macleaya cordata]
MGLIVLLNSLVESFDICAWTVITLVYPLYVSIRAIEGNSNVHNRKFLIYWVLYALIMLFEVTSAKLIEWIPLWSYIKLITVCWLVVPHFDGAVYAYEYIVRPCISVEPQKLVYWFKLRREEFLLHQKDDFLLLAQRYIKENGSEALEKLIIEKSMCNCMETSCRAERNAVETVDEEVAAATPEKVTAFLPDSSNGVAKNVNKQKRLYPISCEINAVETADPSSCGINAVETADKEVAAATPEAVTAFLPDSSSGVAKNVNKVKHTEPNLTRTEHKAVQATIDKRVIELAAAAIAAGGNDGVPALKGSTHGIAAGEKDGVLVPEGSKHDIAAGKKDGVLAPKGSTHDIAAGKKDGVLAPEGSKHDIAAGKKDGVLAPEGSTHDHPNKGQKEWTCALCLVSTTNEANLKDHFQGKKHKAKEEEFRAKNTANKNRNNVALNINTDQKPNQPKKIEPKNKATIFTLPIPKPVKKQQVGYKVAGVDQGAKNLQKNPVLDHDQNEQLWCDLCNLMCNSKSMMRSHLFGKKHLAQCRINEGVVVGSE